MYYNTDVPMLILKCGFTEEKLSYKMWALSKCSYSGAAQQHWYLQLEFIEFFYIRT